MSFLLVMHPDMTIDSAAFKMACVGVCVTEQLLPACMECRAAKGECDLPEYCTGTDSVCLSDVYRRNTDSCTVDGVC